MMKLEDLHVLHHGLNVFEHVALQAAGNIIPGLLGQALPSTPVLVQSTVGAACRGVGDFVDGDGDGVGLLVGGALEHLLPVYPLRKHPPPRFCREERNVDQTSRFTIEQFEEAVIYHRPNPKNNFNVF